MLNINDLKELDIVRRRDGKVCWVLENETEKKLETFLPSMWGQHMLYHYNDDFTYGKDVKYPTQYDSKYDIVAVSKSRSAWKALHLMREYEKAIRDKDEKYIEECMAAFNWIEVL